MAHLLMANDTMVSAGGKEPWHFSQTRDQTRIYQGAGIPWDEIVAESGLGWNVGKAPLIARTPEGIDIPVPDQYATYRVDTSEVLGIVTDAYRIIQNHDVVRILRALSDGGDLLFETAGSLRGNRIVWFLMKLPTHIDIAGLETERHEFYILGTTAHDGSQAFHLLPTDVRVVCKNTHSAALNQARYMYTWRHVGSDEIVLQEARDAMNLTFKFQESVKDTAERLLDQSVTADQADAFLRRLIPTPHSAQDPEAAQRWADNQRAGIQAVWTGTENLAAVRDTRYGLLQAVSDYEQHYKRVVTTKTRTADDARFENALLANRTLAGRAEQILTGSGRLDRDVADALARA